MPKRTVQSRTVAYGMKEFHMTKLLSIKDACAEYGLSRSALYREVEKGRLPMRKIGKSSRISRDDLDTWLAALPIAGKAVAA
jgi:excisionase family DNA binding protein